MDATGRTAITILRSSDLHLAYILLPNLNWKDDNNMNSFINVMLDLANDDPVLAFALLDKMLEQSEKEDDK